MSLFTKSIQVKEKKKGEIRVCIMRRPNKNAYFDIWMPVLSPSNRLLDDYHKGKISWDNYVRRFNREVLIKKNVFLKILTDLSLKYDIILLCWEKSPKQCHRRLVAEACKKINPNLKVFIK